MSKQINTNITSLNALRRTYTSGSCVVHSHPADGQSLRDDRPGRARHQHTVGGHRLAVRGRDVLHFRAVGGKHERYVFSVVIITRVHAVQ